MAASGPDSSSANGGVHHRLQLTACILLISGILLSWKFEDPFVIPQPSPATVRGGTLATTSIPASSPHKVEEEPLSIRPIRVPVMDFGDAIENRPKIAFESISNGWSLKADQTAARAARANGQSQPKKRPIAISLVVMQLTELLEPALESLVNSDIMDYDVTLFYWCNMPDSIATVHMRAFKAIPSIEVPNAEGKNLGIVIPRVEIMNAVLTHSVRFEYILEIHDDMVFFPNWFNNLIKHERPTIGILMPFIFNALTAPEDGYYALSVLHKDLPSDAKLLDLVNGRVLYDTCVQVHPWLLKREMIEEVGYYDPRFSPHQVEDDDFYYRVMQSGWRSYAVRSSWAVHLGGATRGHWLDYDVDHESVFLKKHGFSIDLMKRDVVNRQCHPAVPAVKPEIGLAFDL